MAAAARVAGVHVAIGLQLRSSPIVRRARELIASGALGQVLSLSTYSTAAGFGPDVPASVLHFKDPQNFANLVTIQGAHTVDLAIAMSGELADMSALATAHYPAIRAGDGKEHLPRTTFDHLLLQGRLAKGGTLSVKVAGGRPPETRSGWSSSATRVPRAWKAAPRAASRRAG